MAKSLAEMTPTEMADFRAKAQAARATKVAERRASKLRTDFLDMHHWERLASALGVRLPPQGERCTTTVMRVFLGKVNRSGVWYLEHSGERTLSDFAASNPDWPARAWAGIVCEWVATEQRLELAPELELVTA